MLPPRIDHTCPLPRSGNEAAVPHHRDIQQGSLVLGCFPGQPWVDGRIYRVRQCIGSGSARRYRLFDPDNGATRLDDVPPQCIVPAFLTWRQFSTVSPWDHPDHQIAELRGLRAHVDRHYDDRESWAYALAPMTRANPVMVRTPFPDAETAKQAAAKALFVMELQNAHRAANSLPHP